MPTKLPQGLIHELLIKNGDVAGRDDAAMDLGAYNEPEVEQALIQVASDPETEPVVVRSCAESLVEIWIRRERLPEHILPHLRPEALAELAGYVNWYQTKDRTRQALSEVCRVLWEQWDPIGVNKHPKAFGEYDGYPAAVCALLRRSADDTEIANYLHRIETSAMEVDASSNEHIQRVIASLRGIDLGTLRTPESHQAL